MSNCVRTALAVLTTCLQWHNMSKKRIVSDCGVGSAYSPFFVHNFFIAQKYLCMLCKVYGCIKTQHIVVFIGHFGLFIQVVVVFGCF